ncbi:MAG: hypothetical protein Q9218_001449 [Villophora microphyllina]
MSGIRSTGSNEGSGATAHEHPVNATSQRPLARNDGVLHRLGRAVIGPDFNEEDFGMFMRTLGLALPLGFVVGFIGTNYSNMDLRIVVLGLPVGLMMGWLMVAIKRRFEDDSEYTTAPTSLIDRDPEDAEEIERSPPGRNYNRPGKHNNNPWMYIEHLDNGKRKSYAITPLDELTEGLFHKLSRNRGGMMCCDVCEQDSQCEHRVKAYFMNAAGSLGISDAPADPRQIVLAVIEAVENGRLDEYGNVIRRRRTS